MCTVSWLFEDDGYALLFNRDEKRARGVASPPTLHSQDGVRFLTPTDPDGGGSWVTTNEYGVTVCLLNNYLNNYGAAATPFADLESRGKLPLALADRGTIDAISLRLESIELERFAPFRLLALEPGKPPWACLWDGRRRTVERDARLLMPLTSSSYETAEVEGARRARFRARPDGRFTLEELEELHRSHGGRSRAHSVCMHRPDAQTVSWSRVVVGRESTAFAYRPGAPCEQRPIRTLVLKRASDAVQRRSAAS